MRQLAPRANAVRDATNRVSDTLNAGGPGTRANFAMAQKAGARGIALRATSVNLRPQRLRVLPQLTLGQTDRTAFSYPEISDRFRQLLARLDHF